MGTYAQIPQEHGLELALDNTHLFKLCAPALDKGERVVVNLPSKNTNTSSGNSCTACCGGAV